MDITKLKKGLIIKNYKELCEIIQTPIKTGGAKQKQMQWFKEYFQFHKQGNKFIIDRIYNKDVKAMKDYRGGNFNKVDYIENIEKLILDLLVMDNKGRVFLSRNKILRALQMINDNYAYCKQRISKLAKFLNINEMTVREWYDSTGGMLERNLEKALNNLRNESLIFWSKEITICEAIPTALQDDEIHIIEEKRINKYNEEMIIYKIDNSVNLKYREATDNEKRFIIKTERKIMKELKCRNKQEIIKKGMWDDFQEKIKNIILKEYSIVFYYDSYKILCNEDHIYEKWEELLDLELEANEREKEQLLLNKAIIDRIHKNTTNRSNNAKRRKNGILGKSKKDVIENRITNKYIKDNDKLTDNLIKKDAGNIKKEVIKMKLK